ncbi:MAG: rhodanese-like domain-containing protein [Pyrinomonadaceae bacterium]
MKLFYYAVLGTLILAIGCQGEGYAPSSTAESAKNTDLRVENTAVAHDHEDDVDDAPRITLEDAKKAFDSGDALFLDTRGETFYANEHIKGAVNVTSGNIDETSKDLPKNKKLIAYCS